jgi:hypothetical protein
MARKFVSEEFILIVIITKEIIVERFPSVFSTEENHDGHRLKDNREIERVVTRWLLKKR